MSSQQILMKRLGGFIIDFSCILFTWLAMNFSFSRFLVSFSDHVNVFPVFDFEQHFVLFTAFVIYPICFIGYFTANYYISNGSSLGKIIMGVKFESEKDLTLARCLTRSSLQFASYLCFSLPNLLSFFSKDNRSLIDTMLNTTHTVINPLQDIEAKDFEDVIYLEDHTRDLEEDQKKAA